MTHRGPFQPLLFCDSVILWKPRKDRSILNEQHADIDDLYENKGNRGVITERPETAPLQVLASSASRQSQSSQGRATTGSPRTMTCTLCRHQLQWVSWKWVDPSKSYFREKPVPGEAEMSQTKEGAENQPPYSSPILPWHEVDGGVKENGMDLLAFFKLSP